MAGPRFWRIEDETGRTEKSYRPLLQNLEDLGMPAKFCRGGFPMGSLLRIVVTPFRRANSAGRTSLACFVQAVLDKGFRVALDPGGDGRRWPFFAEACSRRRSRSKLGTRSRERRSFIPSTASFSGTSEGET